MLNFTKHRDELLFSSLKKFVLCIFIIQRAIDGNFKSYHHGFGTGTIVCQFPMMEYDRVVMESIVEQAQKYLYEGVALESAVNVAFEKIDLYLKE